MRHVLALALIIPLVVAAGEPPPPQMIEEAYFACEASRSLQGGIFGKALCGRLVLSLVPVRKMSGNALIARSSKRLRHNGTVQIGVRTFLSSKRSAVSRSANRSVKADPLLQAIACIGSAYLQR